MFGVEDSGVADRREEPTEGPMVRTKKNGARWFYQPCVYVCLFLFILFCFSLLPYVVCLFPPIRLLEQELQTFRLTVQSEQGILEERCSEMEVTVETLTRYNAQLQGMLTQVSGCGRSDWLMTAEVPPISCS